MRSLSGTAEKTSRRAPPQGGGYRAAKYAEERQCSSPLMWGREKAAGHITAERV
jgi:hypothetical protein